MSEPDVTPELDLGTTWPSLEVFSILAPGRRVIPVVRRLMADAETPLSLYRKLAGDRPGTFLLESAEHGGIWSRYSIIGARSRATLTERGGEVVWIGEPPVGAPTTGLATDGLRDVIELLATDPIAGLPPVTGGMVGMIGYDAVRRWEQVPAIAPDVLQIPELAMMLATDLAVLDHADGSVWLIANAINYNNTPDGVDRAWTDANNRLDVMMAELTQPAASTVAVLDAAAAERAAGTLSANMGAEDYLALVEQAKADIRAGEVFQVVLSQRFSMPCQVDALEVYRALRASNPSPYMFLFRIPRPDGTAYDIVGSSPEALVKVSGRCALTHPIAGTRPRGKTPDADVALESELLADPKERSEHVMLVDLGRNDLARVGKPGTVEVVEFMHVRRYSHVMHIESTVAAELRDGCTAYDVLVAAFPAGTLSGAPKLRAMELIERYEPSRRGVYGGVVGYLDFHGELDMAISIRTALIDRGMAHVQAGAGIVADSDPMSEYRECRAKADAVLRAIATAHGLRSAP